MYENKDYTYIYKPEMLMHFDTMVYANIFLHFFISVKQTEGIFSIH